MDETNEQNQLVPLLKIIWAALLMCTAIYGAIAYFLCRPAPDDVRALMQIVTSDQVVMVSYALGIVIFVLGFVVPRMFLRRRPAEGVDRGISTAGAPARVRMALIVRWTLFEAVSIFGLVAAFVAQRWEVFTPLWALCIIGFFASYPTETFVERLSQE